MYGWTSAAGARFFSLWSRVAGRGLQLRLQPRDNELSFKLDAVVTALRESSGMNQTLVVVREGEGGPSEARFFARLIEDRANFPGGAMNYGEYLNYVNRQSLAAAPVQSTQGGPAAQ
jgi:hypothetical protein